MKNVSSFKFIFFSSEMPSKTVSEKEKMQQSFHEKLENLSQALSEDQVRNFLRSEACDMMVFEPLKSQKTWSAEWNNALAIAIGKEKLSSETIGKIQKSLGSFPDGKFGPHSLARLWKLRGQLKDRKSFFQKSYIDAWDSKSVDALHLATNDLPEAELIVLKSLFRNEAMRHGATLIDDTIKVYDSCSVMLAQKGDKRYRIKIDVATQPPHLNWYEVVDDTWYDKTLGETPSFLTSEDAETKKPQLYIVQRGDTLARILNKEFHKSYQDMTMMTVDYRDPREPNAPKAVLDNDRIFPGQKIWIENGVVVIAASDERKAISNNGKKEFDDTIVREYLQTKDDDDSEETAKKELKRIPRVKSSLIATTAPNIRTSPKIPEYIPVYHSWEEYTDVIQKHFAQETGEEKEKVSETFEQMFRIYCKKNNIQAPPTEEHVAQMIDVVLFLIRQNEDLHTDGQLLFYPYFINNSIKDFQLDVIAEREENPFLRMQQTNKAKKKEQQTHQILSIMEISIKDRVWEKPFLEKHGLLARFPIPKNPYEYEEIPDTLAETRSWGDAFGDIQEAYAKATGETDPDKIYRMARILRGYLNQNNIPAPNKTGVELIIRSLVQHMKSYPDLYKNGTFAINTNFYLSNSLDDFQKAQKSGYQKEIFGVETLEEAEIEYKKTQSTLVVLDQLMSHHVWDPYFTEY